jgi:high-affinity Fe2+/Pb2+ permease
MVLRQSIGPVAVGLACGVAGALILGGAIASLLYEVRPRDPIVLTTVLAIVAAVGVVSVAVATARGLQIDPAAALRDE